MSKRKKIDSEAGAAPELAEDRTATPDRERIAMRAYELYLSRGGSDGQAMEDWLSAEQELLNRGDASRDS